MCAPSLICTAGPEPQQPPAAGKAAAKVSLSPVPMQVADAMRTTIGRMLGTLPESFFDVTVAANKTEHLAQLCSSTVMTGYLFRNVQQRLDLQQQMGELDGASPAGSRNEPKPRAALCMRQTCHWQCMLGADLLILRLASCI